MRDDQLIHGHHSSLEYYKKGLSYFIPNRLMAWDPRSQTGNPTKSTEINDLIKSVKTRQVRKQGKKSEARRPLEKEEYDSPLRILQTPFRHNPFMKFYVPSFMAFQYNLIGRLDDTAKFMKLDLKPNRQFPFALLWRMCWSKNVHEERDAPDQILLGADNPLYCVLLRLAVVLQIFYMINGSVGDFVFSNDNNFKRSKKNVYNTLKQVWANDDFILTEEDLLGSHSLRKYAATFARRNGCSRDDMDSRGQWKRQRRQVDSYIDTELHLRSILLILRTVSRGSILLRKSKKK